jgi:AraC-like DNA-binding protein
MLPPATLRRLLRARDRLRDAPAIVPTLPELAADANMSRAHFLREFARAFGRTPKDYVIDLRLEHAKRALARGASVTEACFDVGYSSLGTFSRTFADRVGVSPRAWQRRVRTVLPSAELWPAVWIPGCFLQHYTPSTFGEAATIRKT